jgi:hypothetical protein
MQSPKEKGQTMIYKTLRRKLKIEQHEPHKKTAIMTDMFRLS